MNLESKIAFIRHPKNVARASLFRFYLCIEHGVEEHKLEYTVDGQADRSEQKRREGRYILLNKTGMISSRDPFPHESLVSDRTAAHGPII